MTQITLCHSKNILFTRHSASCRSDWVIYSIPLPYGSTPLYLDLLYNCLPFIPVIRPLPDIHSSIITFYVVPLPCSSLYFTFCCIKNFLCVLVASIFEMLLVKLTRVLHGPYLYRIHGTYAEPYIEYMEPMPYIHFPGKRENNNLHGNTTK